MAVKLRLGNSSSGSSSVETSGSSSFQYSIPKRELGNERKDETLKLMTYINLASVQEYVLIEQDIADVTVLRRREGWLPNHYFLGDDITFESIGLTLPVADIYQRVQNQDVAAFLSSEAEVL